MTAPLQVPTSRRTVILAKCPRPGLVKTRLVPPLSPERAAGLAEAMLRDAARRLERVAGARTLWFAPAEERAWFERAFPGLPLAAQEGPGLGARLAHAFEVGLGDARTQVALGSDQPLIPAAAIGRAHAALEDGADLVLGPDAGGGYYLIGLSAPWSAASAALFDAPMSSARTLAVTREVAQTNGLTVVELEPGLDVDLAVDLVRLRRALERASEDDPDYPRHTAAYLLAHELGNAAAPPEPVG